MSLKSSFAGAAVAALVLAAPAATAFANNPGHGQGGTHAKSHSHFTANGRVTAVGDTSFTMHVKGGSKDLHGTDVTVSLADNAKVRRDGAKAQLSDLQVGDWANAVGSRAEDGSLTARHVNAHAPAADSTDTTDTSSTDTSGTDTTGTTGTDTTGTDTTGTTGTDTGTTGTDTGTGTTV